MTTSHIKKTPTELSESKRVYSKDKVVLLARDPRDVVVSRFFSRKYREKKYDGDIHSFLREDRGSLATIVRYYNIWIEQRHQPKEFMLMKYEQIYESPQEQLRMVLDFADMRPHDAQLLSEAVSYARFENMRHLEAETMLRNTALHPTEKHDTRTYKTRKGIIGDHRNQFSDADRAYADRYIRDHLHPEFGYGESAA